MKIIKLLPNQAPAIRGWPDKKLVKIMPLDIVSNVIWHEITNRLTRSQFAANNSGGNREKSRADEVEGVTAAMHVRFIAPSVTKAA